jgi:hypothetical protein
MEMSTDVLVLRGLSLLMIVTQTPTGPKGVNIVAEQAPVIMIPVNTGMRSD